jgi:hypothetical protein
VFLIGKMGVFDKKMGILRGFDVKNEVFEAF